MSNEPVLTAPPQFNLLAERYEAQILAWGEQAAARFRVARDIGYGPHPRQNFDVMAPHGASGLPVLIFFHGGGFASGCKEWCAFMAAAVCAGSALLVCANTRLFPDFNMDDILADGAALVRHVRDNIAQFGGSPDRIHVGGHSAGAALAAMLALSPGLVEMAGLSADAIQSVVSVSGSLNRFSIAGTIGSNYGFPPGPMPVDDFSPLGQVAHARAPFLVLWGGRERQRERVERSSMAMISALRDGNAAVEWYILPQADHFDTHTVFNDVDHEWSRVLRDWLVREAVRA